MCRAVIQIGLVHQKRREITCKSFLGAHDANSFSLKDTNHQVKNNHARTEPQPSALKMARLNDREGITGPSFMGFPPPHLGAHGIETCCWSNVECNDECCTLG